MININGKNIIYLDSASTTFICKEAQDSIQECLNNFFNPSSIYSQANNNSKIIEESRKKIAITLNANPEQIFFTSGGCEGDSWIIKNFKYPQDKHHIITSSIEHHAILRACKEMENKGYEVTYINPNKEGVISTQDVIDAIRPDTALISIMMVNNVLGTIQPVKEIAQYCREQTPNIFFHTDAVQAMGHLNINVKTLQIDALTLSGHKIHAPKGIGAVYVKNPEKMSSLINGGGQENGLRAGTENIPYIKALGICVEKYCSKDAIKKDITLMKENMNYLINNLFSTKEESKHLTDYNINGTFIPLYRIPGNLNLSLKNINSEVLVYLLGEENICISVGSACDTGEHEPSYVLKAIDSSPVWYDGMIRITLDHSTTKEDIDIFISSLLKNVKKLRGYT